MPEENINEFLWLYLGTGKSKNMAYQVLHHDAENDDIVCWSFDNEKSPRYGYTWRGNMKKFLKEFKKIDSMAK